jgi:transposase-like protein
MARHHSPRHPLFRQRWFADNIITTCVRWYLRFKLSYRELAELARELGVSVAPSTVLRWVVRYVPEFEKCWQAYERPVGDSWRVDETYLKVGGQWVYLYRSVDKQGKTVESYLSRTRDVTAAKAPQPGTRPRGRFELALSARRRRLYDATVGCRRRPD